MNEKKEDIKLNEFHENRIETLVHLSFLQVNSSFRLHIHCLKVKQTKFTTIEIDHLSRFTLTLNK